MAPSSFFDDEVRSRVQGSRCHHNRYKTDADGTEVNHPDKYEPAVKAVANFKSASRIVS